MILGLYQYFDVSFTNLGVVCTASESVTIRKWSEFIQNDKLVIQTTVSLFNKTYTVMKPKHTKKIENFQFKNLLFVHICIFNKAKVPEFETIICTLSQLCFPCTCTILPV